jgi:hypothetical protein
MDRLVLVSFGERRLFVDDDDDDVWRARDDVLLHERYTDLINAMELQKRWMNGIFCIDTAHQLSNDEDC